MVSTFRLNSRFQRLAMAAAAIIVSTMIAWLAGTSITVESASAADELSPPSQPAGLTATAGNTQVALEWDDPGDSTITKYQLLQLVTAKLTASDGAEGDSFGHSVAVNGSTAVVSAYQDDDDNRGDDSGSAYVFTKDSSGKWTQQAKLTASDGAAGDEFGISVAVDGDTVVVGAQKDDDDNRGDDSGSAYVFVKPAGGWANATETAKLTASDGAAGDLFGISVAVDGDTVVVGAQKDDDDDRGDDSGSAYVFVKPNGGWDDWDELDSDDKDKLTAKLTASDGSATDSFGWAVAADSDTVVIGAFGDDRTIDDTDIANLGAAYVFTKPAGGWADATETAKLTAPDAEAADLFGVSVAVDGEVVLVGAHLEDENAFGAGAAYVFTKPAGGWADVDDDDVAKLTASDGESNDRFGLSVAVDGSTAVIGANDHTHVTEKSGSAYVFTKNSAGVWIQEFELNASDGAADDRFGYSVALDGDTLFVGAEQDDDKGTDSGSVHIANITKWSDIADSSATTLTATGLTNDVEHTFQLRAVNDSGHSPEATVTATPTLLPPAQPTGFAAIAGNAEVQLSWIEPQPAPTMPVDMHQLLQLVTAKLTASDGAADDAFGYSVAADSDTVVIGAFGDDRTIDDTDIANLGAAYVFVKDSSGKWTQQAKLTALDGAAGDEFGISVAVDGDTVVVGAHKDDDDGVDSGSAYVFVKPAGGWADATETAKLTASDGAAGDEFGFSVAVDGDTALVGAYGDDRTINDVDVTDLGAAYVFTKPAGGWDDWDELDSDDKDKLTAKLTASDGSATDSFGWAVAADSDTVVIGAFGDDRTIDETDIANLGAAYVFTKPAGGWADATETAKLTASDGATGDEFGISVAVDGDTVVVGAHKDDDDGDDSGSAYVFTKPAGGWADATETAKLTASDGAAGDLFGISVAVDGSTAVIGANDHTHGTEKSGSAYVFTKNSAGVWIQEFELNASDGAADDRFGYSVALDGDTLFVGAEQDDDKGTDSGSVHIANITKWSDIADSSATTLTATGLTNDVEHTFQLRAVNDSGHSPEATVTATPTLLPPAQPTGFAAIAGNAEVQLSWIEPQPAPTMPVDMYQLRQFAKSKLTASDATKNDLFGLSVAVDGSTAVVGAPGTVGDDSDSAYLYTKDSSGVWTQIAKLTDDDSATDDGFGYSVAVDGDTVVVGAPNDVTPVVENPMDPGDYANTGSAYVFVKPASSGGWADIDVSDAVKLTASDANGGDRFGHSVAVDGDAVLVGAQGGDSVGSDDVSIVNSGSAYLFTKPASSGGWADIDVSDAAKLTASDANGGDRFGWSVALDSDTAVVGAPNDVTPVVENPMDPGDYANTGSAFVFVKPSGGWGNGNETAKLTAPISDAGAGDWFGTSVAVDGDVVLVGAEFEDEKATDAGSAYVFIKPDSANGWADIGEDDVTKLTVSDGAADDRFGKSVAVDGDTAVIGAYNHDHGSGTNGSAYIFTKNSSGAWIEDFELTASDGATTDSFGLSVALDGNTAVIGAPEDDDSGTDSGSVYMVDISTWTDIADSSATTLTHTATGLTNNIEYTFQLRAANDSGHSPEATATATPTLLPPAQPTGFAAIAGNAQVSLSWQAPEYAPTMPVEGYELWQVAESAKLVESGGEENDAFGDAVAIDGDTAVVGASNDVVDNYRTGAAYIFVRDPDSGLWSRKAKLTAANGAASDSFGISVALDGDTIVVGASIAGSAYVFTEPDEGWADANETAKLTGSASGEFGSTVAVNGNTIVVGADRDTNGDSSNAGSAYVFTRPSDGWEDKDTSTAAKLTAAIPAANDYFGQSVAVDGGTVVVGATGRDSSKGSAYVFTEPDTGVWVNSNTAATLTAPDGETGDEFGRSVAVDGDTVVVGADLDDSSKGSAYVFTEPASDGGWGDWNALDDDDKTKLTAKLTASDRDIASDNGGNTFGSSVAVDGDTVVVGADGVDLSDSVTNSGAAYVFTKPTTGWTNGTEAVKLTASDGGMNDRYGDSVAVDGDTVVIGAHGNKGAAYVVDIDDWTAIEASDSTTTSHTVTSLANDVEYWFRIRAANDIGPGPDSNGASATPRLPKPGKPTGLSAQAGDAEVTLNWDYPNDDSSIDKYELAEAVQNSPLIAIGAAENDQFGISVAVDGDIAVIGAFRDDDNAGSAYIFTRDSISGVWSQKAKLTAPDASAVGFGDQFGYSVAVHDQTVVVGAFRDEHGNVSQAGSAYVFTEPDGGWDDWDGLNDLDDPNNDDESKEALTAKLTAPDAGADDLFGASVAVHGDAVGDTVVVGAFLDDDDDDGDDSDLVWVGSAYVFTEPTSGGGWGDWNDQAALTAKLRLQASDRLPNSQFGFAVAVDGDTVLIGAHGYDPSFKRDGRGSAYIFTEPDNGWAAADTDAAVKLVASDGAPGDWFGYSVALDGETAVIGARLHNDDRAGAGSGAAYVFTRESGAWTEKAKLTASDGAAHDNFGFSVSVDADTVVAGAWLDDDDGSASGSAYIFKKPEQGWAPSLETTKLTAPDGAANDRFGTSVAVDGKFAAVGAYRKTGIPLIPVRST